MEVGERLVHMFEMLVMGVIVYATNWVGPLSHPLMPSFSSCISFCSRLLGTGLQEVTDSFSVT